MRLWRSRRMTHLCSLKVTTPRARLGAGLARAKRGLRFIDIVHAEGVRFASPSSAEGA